MSSKDSYKQRYAYVRVKCARPDIAFYTQDFYLPHGPEGPDLDEIKAHIRESQLPIKWCPVCNIYECSHNIYVYPGKCYWAIRHFYGESSED